jgi:transposase
MKDFQPAIIRMHENGYSERQIAEILSILKSIVHGAIEKLEVLFGKPRKREIKVSGFL